jgi:hypothetical protein
LREQVDHLDRRQCDVDPLVAVFATGSRQRLLDVIASEHAEGNGNARIAHHLTNAVRHAVADVVEMRCATSNHCAERDDRVVAPGPRQCARRLRNLERTRHPGDVNRVGRRTAALEFCDGAFQQLRADQVIEARDDDAYP